MIGRFALAILASGPAEPPAADHLPAPTTTAVSPRSVSPERAVAPLSGRPLGAFPVDVARNLGVVWAPENLGRVLAGGGAALLASAADGATIDYFDRHPMRTFGRTGAAVGRAGAVAGVSAGLLLAGQLAHGDRFRTTTYDMSQAVLVNAAYTFAIKASVGRQRPHEGDRRSFPSGHTSNAFASAAVWAHHYGRRAAVPAYAVAGLIGASRLASGAHHLSDVLAGATLGHVVGRSVARGADQRASRRRFVVAPDAGPAGDGVGLAVSVGF